MRTIKKLLLLFVVFLILTTLSTNLVSASVSTSASSLISPSSSIDSVKQQLFQNQKDSIQSNAVNYEFAQTCAGEKISLT